MPAIHTFSCKTLLQAPVEDVFQFFCSIENLEKMTPSSLRFETLTPKPIRIQQGSIIDHRIHLHGIPMRWRTEICVWEPPNRFVDRQLIGPYSLWEHEHRFEFLDGSTQMTDTVRYRSKGWLFEPLIERFFVRKQVEAIFQHRTERIQALFGNSTC